LVVGRSLYLSGTDIKKLPANLTVNGWLSLADTKIYQLLKNYNGTFNNLNLTFYSIKKLPDNIRIRNDLNLEFSDIKKLPDNLNINGDLILAESQIEKLPKNLSVGGALYLEYTDIKKLPKTLALAVP
jgi:hypothetical protein